MDKTASPPHSVQRPDAATVVPDQEVSISPKTPSTPTRQIVIRRRRCGSCSAKTPSRFSSPRLFEAIKPYPDVIPSHTTDMNFQERRETPVLDTAPMEPPSTYRPPHISDVEDSDFAPRQPFASGEHDNVPIIGPSSSESASRRRDHLSSFAENPKESESSLPSSRPRKDHSAQPQPKDPNPASVHDTLKSSPKDQGDMSEDVARMRNYVRTRQERAKERLRERIKERAKEQAKGRIRAREKEKDEEREHIERWLDTAYSQEPCYPSPVLDSRVNFRPLHRPDLPRIYEGDKGYRESSAQRPAWWGEPVPYARPTGSYQQLWPHDTPFAAERQYHGDPYVGFPPDPHGRPPLHHAHLPFHTAPLANPPPELESSPYVLGNRRPGHPPPDFYGPHRDSMHAPFYGHPPVPYYLAPHDSPDSFLHPGTPLPARRPSCAPSSFAVPYHERRAVSSHAWPGGRDEGLKRQPSVRFAVPMSPPSDWMDMASDPGRAMSYEDVSDLRLRCQQLLGQLSESRSSRNRKSAFATLYYLQDELERVLKETDRSRRNRALVGSVLGVCIPLAKQLFRALSLGERRGLDWSCRSSRYAFWARFQAAMEFSAGPLQLVGLVASALGLVYSEIRRKIAKWLLRKTHVLAWEMSYGVPSRRSLRILEDSWKWILISNSFGM